MTAGRRSRRIVVDAPPEYGGVFIGPDFVEVEPDEARRLLAANPSPEQRRNTITVVHWSITAECAARDFYTQFMPALRALGAPDAVRLVFGFDS
jgi:hypothetical protein